MEEITIYKEQLGIKNGKEINIEVKDTSTMAQEIRKFHNCNTNIIKFIANYCEIKPKIYNDVFEYNNNVIYSNIEALDDTIISIFIKSMNNDLDVIQFLICLHILGANFLKFKEQYKQEVEDMIKFPNENVLDDFFENFIIVSTKFISEMGDNYKLYSGEHVKDFVDLVKSMQSNENKTPIIRSIVQFIVFLNDNSAELMHLINVCTKMNDIFNNVSQDKFSNDIWKLESNIIFEFKEKENLIIN